jgi:hypothetical protein
MIVWCVQSVVFIPCFGRGEGGVGLIYGGIIVTTWFHEELAQVTNKFQESISNRPRPLWSSIVYITESRNDLQKQLSSSVMFTQYKHATRLHVPHVSVYCEMIHAVEREGGRTSRLRVKFKELTHAISIIMYNNGGFSASLSLQFQSLWR